MSSNDYGKWIGGIAGFMYGGVLGAFVGYHLGKTIGRNFGPKKKMFEMFSICLPELVSTDRAGVAQDYCYKNFQKKMKTED